MNLHTTLFIVIGAALLFTGSVMISVITEVFARERFSRRLRLGTIIFALVAALPELLMSIMASAKGLGVVAVSTPIGSGMINVLLLCGLAAIIRPTEPYTKFPKRSIPLVIAAAAMVAGVSMVGGIFAPHEQWVIPRWGGAALIFVYLMIVYFAYGRINATPDDSQEAETKRNVKVGYVVFLSLLAIALIVGGAYLTTDAAFNIIKRGGGSQEMIGLLLLAPIAAIPEFVAIIHALSRRESPYYYKDLFNSTTSNLLLVLGIVALIAPLPVYNAALIDLGLIAVGALLVLGTVFFGPGQRISRGEGIFLLLAYIAYVCFITLRQPSMPNLFF